MKKEKSKREKGMEFQRRIRRWLMERGWDCVNIPPRGILITDKKTKQKRFISLRNDIFGCDLIARKAFTELWVQATLDRAVGRKIEELKKHLLMDSANIDTQIWIKVESGKINILEVHKVEGHPEPLQYREIGKIIRGKFYAAEGFTYEF